MFNRGDLVFKLIDLNNIKTSRVGLVLENGAMSSAYIRLIKNSKNYYEKYFYYWYYKLYLEEVYNKLGSGVRETIGKNELLLLEIPLPPLKEQEQIANYLDWKINEIDKLIAKEKEKIELLNKLSDVRISNYIWSDIKKYKIERIKNLFSLRNERNTSTQDVELISLYSKLGVVRNRDVEYKTGNKNTTIEGYKKVYVDDIVVNIMLCWMGAIGVSKYSGVTSPAYDIYTPDLNKVIPIFYHYLFRTREFKDELYRNGKGIVLMKWRVYSEKFTNINVPVPSLSEQQDIVKKIQKQINDVKKSINEIERIITSLNELKQSLISEVVTGQIDVRDVKIPVYEKFNASISNEIEKEVEADD